MTVTIRNNHRFIRCFIAILFWCKTAFGDAANHSKSLKSPLPLRIGTLLEPWMYTEILDDALISILLRPGTTSLNEAANSVINGYAYKYRDLRGPSYAAACARGVCQWDNPCNHIIEEMESYGLCPSQCHRNWFEAQIRKRNYVHEWATSRERNLQKAQKKYGLPVLDKAGYIGGCAAFYGGDEWLDLEIFPFFSSLFSIVSDNDIRDRCAKIGGMIVVCCRGMIGKMISCDLSNTQCRHGKGD